MVERRQDNSLENVSVLGKRCGHVRSYLGLGRLGQPASVFAGPLTAYVQPVRTEYTTTDALSLLKRLQTFIIDILTPRAEKCLSRE